MQLIICGTDWLCKEVVLIYYTGTLAHFSVPHVVARDISHGVSVYFKIMQDLKCTILVMKSGICNYHLTGDVSDAVFKILTYGTVLESDMVKIQNMGMFQFFLSMKCQC